MNQKRPPHGYGETRLARRVKTISQISAGAMIPSMFLVGIVVRNATSRGAILGAIGGIVVIVWGTTCQNLEGGAAALRFPFHQFMIGPIATFTIVATAWLESRVRR